VSDIGAFDAAPRPAVNDFARAPFLVGTAVAIG
jgi:hypothetical protein